MNEINSITNEIIIDTTFDVSTAIYNMLFLLTFVIIIVFLFFYLKSTFKIK